MEGERLEAGQGGWGLVGLEGQRRGQRVIVGLRLWSGGSRRRE